MADCQLTAGYAFYFWTFFIVKRSYKIPARNLFHLFQWSVLWHMKWEKTWVAKQNLASLSSNSKLHWNVAFQTLISLCDSAYRVYTPGVSLLLYESLNLHTFISFSLPSENGLPLLSTRERFPTFSTESFSLSLPYTSSFKHLF